MWCEGGWAAVTMRGVCARAGLNDRYFYESFEDRDALLAAIWDGVRDETAAAITSDVKHTPPGQPLEMIQRTVETAVNSFAVNPRRAVILFGDHAGSELLEHRRHELILTMTDIAVAAVAPYLRADVDANEFRRSVIMTIGGFQELVMAWRRGAVEATPDEIIEQATRFFTLVGKNYLTSAQ